MKRFIVTCLCLAGCSPSKTKTAVPLDAAASSQTDVAAPSQTTRTPPKLSPYASRQRPDQTFDLLSGQVEAGQLTTQRTHLQSGWKVSGPPKLVIDPISGELAKFSIEKSFVETATDGDYFVVVARNVGNKPARFIADVPYRKP